MLGRARQRITYANVISSIAVFIALGGTSYALARNSVGAKQIRSAAVRSSEVKDRSVAVRDLSTSARRALRGPTGATGWPGPSGPPGPSGVTYRAAINSGGVRIRGNAVIASIRGINEYLVGFDRSVDDCVSTATLAAVEGGVTQTPPPGRITVARESGRVLVKTYDTDGSVKSLPFHLIVAC